LYKAGGRLAGQYEHGEHRNEKWRRAPVVRPSDVEAGLRAAAMSAAALSAAARAAPALTTTLSAPQLLRLVHLCDTALPTGGFAHSGGLEAALQFGLLGTRRGAPMAASLRELGTTAALHAVWLQAPFALAAHQLLAEALPHLRPSSGAAAGTSTSAAVGTSSGAAAGTSSSAAVGTSSGGAWPADHVETALAVAMAALNAQQHALLAANGPACRASMLQGSTLSRIATNWLGGAQHGAHGQDGADGTGGAAAAAARGVLALPARQAHGAPALGALAALLGLPARSAVDAFIYMTTRDFVSAAVRLNLIGPLAAISLQSEVVSDVARRSADVMQLGCAGAAGSAPLPLVIPLPLMSTEDQ
jgi:urease accessory protein UreF